MKRSKLPNEYRNLHDVNFNGDANVFGVSEPAEEIHYNFTFSLTPEGVDFWWQVYEAESVEELPKIPEQTTSE